MARAVAYHIHTATLYIAGKKMEKKKFKRSLKFFIKAPKKKKWKKKLRKKFRFGTLIRELEKFAIVELKSSKRERRRGCARFVIASVSWRGAIQLEKAKHR
ncbi:MAG: hypothetical protein PHV93_04805 [Candidatus Pacebacteria bacterium]|nr:hypothetical protein [Candidatus Paceibacterota bacterium]